MYKHSIYSNERDGEVVSVRPKGEYLILRAGVVGYSEDTDTAPGSVEITTNGAVQSVAVSEHPDYPSVSVGEATLPTERPLGVSVQGKSWVVYRTSELPSSVDQSHEVGEGYDAILTTEAQTQVRSFAFQAANALNNGSAWPNIKAPRPPKAPVGLVKQDLVGFTKMKWAEADTVEAGDILSHDNSATRGLWKADVDTTAEPTKDSSDWTLVFEVTV
jgi:hypothetical protein